MLDATADSLALKALRYYVDECSGAEPSISVFHRMVDEALAAQGTAQEPIATVNVVHCGAGMQRLDFADESWWHKMPIGEHKLYTHPAHEGEVVVTKTQAGQIVAVTRQDEEGRVLSVIAESEVAPAAAAPDGWKFVPIRPTEEMLKAGQEAVWEFHPEDTMFENERKAMDAYSAMLEAAPPSPGAETKENSNEPCI